MLFYIMYLMLSYDTYDILGHLVFVPNLSESISNQNTKSKNVMQQKHKFWPCKLSPTLPKPSWDLAQTLENWAKMESRSLQKPFWREFWIQAPKNNVKERSKRCQNPPNPSQNLPKIMPKPSQNQWKNAIKNNIIWGIVFFTIFTIFELKIHRFLIWFLTWFEPQVHIKIHAFFPLLSASFSIEREKYNFVKIELSPRREHDF